ncbi:hypothetical protein F511_12483 [Dorcoceras hygrometricum]|uniref:Uncharacterized protein n=1 Tax=Dorcoceras hygrometricum TaxID=472368 RepID=A0A2Z7C3L8_9LAMI|nr:hypothetical protein F511_12483 [Dorcoceras hygrometricum]
MGNTDPRHKSRKTKYEVKPQYEELIKMAKHATCYNQCYECMRAIKESDSETRSVIPSQLDGRHSNPVVTTPMIALDFSGTTTQSASHNVALNQFVNHSVNQAQDQTQQQANIFHSREIQSCSRFKPLRAAQFVPQSSEFYLTDSIQGTAELMANATSFHLVQNSRQKLLRN